MKEKLGKIDSKTIAVDFAKWVLKIMKYENNG